MKLEFLQQNSCQHNNNVFLNLTYNQMNEILMQLLLNHEQRMKQCNFINKFKNTLLNNKLIQMIDSYHRNQEKRTQLDIALINRLHGWTVVQGYEKTVFKKWTKKMLESLELAREQIENIIYEDSILDLYIHFFNCRGDFVTSYQIQSIKLKIGFIKSPIYQILADRLISHIKYELLKKIKAIDLGQGSIERFAKIELIGEKLRQKTRTRYKFFNRLRKNSSKPDSFLTNDEMVSSSNGLGSTSGFSRQFSSNPQNSVPYQVRNSSQEPFIFIKTIKRNGIASPYLRDVTKSREEDLFKRQQVRTKIRNLYKGLDLENEDYFSFFTDPNLMYAVMIERNRAIKEETQRYEQSYQRTNCKSRGKLRLKMQIQKSQVADQARESKQLLSLSYIRYQNSNMTNKW